MMTSIRILFFYLLIASSACSQPAVPAQRPSLSHSSFDQELTSLLDFSVPLMGIDELRQKQQKVLLLDAREKEEYNSSHIEGAKHLGYKAFNEDVLNGLPKDTMIVLYCSVGYRSEKIGERLQKAGFTNVHNLYGSIFEWVNKGYPVVDLDNQPTNKVHTYNRKWSQWVKNPEINKIW